MSVDRKPNRYNRRSGRHPRPDGGPSVALSLYRESLKGATAKGSCRFLSASVRRGGARRSRFPQGNVLRVLRPTFTGPLPTRRLSTSPTPRERPRSSSSRATAPARGRAPGAAESQSLRRRAASPHKNHIDNNNDNNNNNIQPVRGGGPLPTQTPQPAPVRALRSSKCRRFGLRSVGHSVSSAAACRADSITPPENGIELRALPIRGPSSLSLSQPNSCHNQFHNNHNHYN